MAGAPYVKRHRAIKTLFRPQISEDRQMATWSKDESHKIAEADDLPIAPFRENGVTYGSPHVDLVVAVDDTLYVRAYNLWTLDHCESPDIWSHSPWRWHNSRTRGTKDLRSRYRIERFEK
jgi:hypothetical protein